MVARYWVGGSGYWDSETTDNWAAYSGGPGGQSPPQYIDDVYFDGNSGAGNVIVNWYAYCQNLTVSANCPITLIDGGNGGPGQSYLYCYGNLNIAAGAAATLNLAQIYFYALEEIPSKSITTNGKTFGSECEVGCYWGQITADHIACSSLSVQFNEATDSFSLADGGIIEASYVSIYSNTPSGTGTLTFGNNSNVYCDSWSVWGIATVNKGLNSTINIIGGAGGSFDGGGMNYGNLRVNSCTITDYNNHFDTITIQAAGYLGLPPIGGSFGAGNYINVGIYSEGTEGALATLESYSKYERTAAALMGAGGFYDISYATISYIAASNGTFRAHHAVNGGGNSGWTFITREASAMLAFMA